MYLSTNLSYLRKEKNLTQTALGKKVQLSKQIICNYEKSRREPNLKTLINIAHYLEVTIDDLLKKDLSKGDDSNVSTGSSS